MEKHRIHPQRFGDRVRASFSQEKEVLEMPNLLEVQKNSYRWFIQDGLKEVFEEISPITDFSGALSLEFLDFDLNSKPKYSIEETKSRNATYSAPLNVRIRLTNSETGEVQDHEIFMGDFPLMTDTGTFVINGAERVVVSQLVRSPGIYYSRTLDKLGKPLYSCQVIPNRGAWLEYETDSNDIFNVRLDRTRKIPVTILIRALGVGTDAEIVNMFGEDPKIVKTMERDTAKSEEEGLLEIYRRMRPGEPPTVESADSLLKAMLYEDQRYNLGRVGRYKFNKKLDLRFRIVGTTLAEDVIDDSTGEVLAEAGTLVTRELADNIQNAGIPFVWVQTDERNVKVLSNQAVDIRQYVDLTEEELLECGINEKVYYPELVRILDQELDHDALMTALKKESFHLIPRHITFQDIMASINYNLNLEYDMGTIDDIDHLGNRRIRCVGELLQNQFRIGAVRMERGVRERMSTQDPNTVTPQSLVNIRPVTAAIKEFFGSSQLSQFMDQNNPLAELTHKRRLSALGPGGLSRDRAGFEVRDVHYSHYGRMCPVETPEGPNIGLINSLASYARINIYGFIEAPYRRVDHSGKLPVVTDEVVYMMADEEENYHVAQANEKLDDEGHFLNAKVTGRYRNDNIEIDNKEIDFMDVSPKQVFSVATSLVPFLQNDDPTRALMGSNMQRRAVPLMTTDSPIVGTGMEYKAAIDSGECVVSDVEGDVIFADATKIIIRNDADGTSRIFNLRKFQRNNQGTCFNQKPRVSKGDHVIKGQAIADGPSTYDGELALGRNPLIGFMTWEGYNYEDAVLLSERLVAEDIYTSLHIEVHEAESRDTKLGPEEITNDIPNIGDDARKNLDERGIVRIGAEVHAGDILVGKVTPKGETDLTPEERLLRAIFGEKAREVRDASLRVPHGEEGIVVDVKTFDRTNSDELAPGVNEVVHVYIAHKRKIQIGDKMAGRHGNKGVVSRVLPVEDMPFLPNGRPLDILLSPLGVPSRMNLGQVLEMHLGLAAKALGFKVTTPIFEGANDKDVTDTLLMANDYVNHPWDEFKEKYKEVLSPEIMDYLEDHLDHRAEWAGVPIREDGKVPLRDGRSGEYFANYSTVGYMYYMKLHHLVDDKIHARSTGPYALVTQQPLGGKAQFGGQRFGEMEVWALEAYGAAYTLQEILTFKSDDIVGRVKAYESIVKGENIPQPGVPESFKVLLKELQSLGLDVRVLSADLKEIELREDMDDDMDLEEKPLDVNIEGWEDTPQARKTYTMHPASSAMPGDDDYTSIGDDEENAGFDDDEIGLEDLDFSDAGFSEEDPDDIEIDLDEQ